MWDWLDKYLDRCMQNGLFTEDGEPAGSGFTIRERRRDTVQMILSNYREEQMELL